MITLAQLEDLLAQFPNRRIGLVGDLFLDRYLELQPGDSEISIETGLEAYQINAIRNQPGALGTIICNLAALGARQLLPLTVIGDDGHGFDLMRTLERLPVDPSWVLQAPDRLTPTYTKPIRPVDDSWVELNRLDVRSRRPLSPDTARQVCDALQRLHQACDGLIVLDQVTDPEAGVVCGPVRETLRSLAAQGNKVIYVDSRANLGAFQGCLLKGNEAEICRVASADDVQEAAVALAKRNEQPVICTRGERGSLIAHSDGRCRDVPGVRVAEPTDIVGAGDAATSGIMLSLLSGATLEQAAVIGNLVASITVQQIGTTGTATPQQVIERWQQWETQRSKHG